MPNNPKAAENLKPFKKGDARINKKGRPRSFDALRALAQSLAHEAVETQQGKMTAVEVILRQMAKDPKQRVQFLEYAFGKVPTVNEVTGKDGAPIKTITVIEIVKAQDE
jgi:hypothetical protein